MIVEPAAGLCFGEGDGIHVVSLVGDAEIADGTRAAVDVGRLTRILHRHIDHGFDMGDDVWVLVLVILACDALDDGITGGVDVGVVVPDVDEHEGLVAHADSVRLAWNVSMMAFWLLAERMAVTVLLTNGLSILVVSLMRSVFGPCWSLS